MTYNLTFMGTSTNLLQVTVAVNSASGGLFGALFLFVFWLGTLIVMSKQTDPLVALLGSSFFTSVLGILLIILNIVTWQILIIPVMAVLISVLILMFAK